MLKLEDLEGQGYYRYSPRVWDHPGPVVDLGCLNWNWCRDFADKKEVIGFDPFQERTPAWAQLSRMAVGPYSGYVTLYGSQGSRSATNRKLINNGGPSVVHMISLQEMIDTMLRGREPSILKMNIEGMEFGTLISMQKPVADQIIVAFHDRAVDPHPSKAREVIIDYLSEWYDGVQTCEKNHWWVFVKRLDI